MLFYILPAFFMLAFGLFSALYTLLLMHVIFDTNPPDR